MEIKTPEMLFGMGNVRKKIIAYELASVKLPKKINLEDLAERIPECEYCPEHSRNATIRTRLGSVRVWKDGFQILNAKEPWKVNILASFIAEALKTNGECSFEKFLRSLDRKDVGGFLESWIEQDLKPVYEDIVKKPLKRLRRR